MSKRVCKGVDRKTYTDLRQLCQLPHGLCLRRLFREEARQGSRGEGVESLSCPRVSVYVIPLFTTPSRTAYLTKATEVPTPRSATMTDASAERRSA